MVTITFVRLFKICPYNKLAQGYLITFNKGSFTKIPSLPRSVHSGEKLQHNTENTVTNITHVTRTKHAVSYGSTSKLVEKIAFLVIC